ncbi:unnamed protein product [Meloidogyne enterolobii]|uniref:Uncharacterized protein n=2 Tax=Meloidogyne enterolobii TaxID=390850 RepID=A0A6V7XJB5_MELEN|nr:unnamed protein product [Meloidogyne enterolobii]
MSSNSRALRNSLNDLENAMEVRINHNNDMNGDCFCRRVLNSPYGFVECCGTIGHKECLINFVSEYKRCPSMDCLRRAKEEDVKDFNPPGINILREIISPNNILSFLKYLWSMVVSFVKNVSLADSKLITTLIGAFNHFFTGKPSISGGTADSKNMNVDTFKKSKLRWIIGFIDRNKGSMILLAVALGNLN